MQPCCKVTFASEKLSNKLQECVCSAIQYEFREKQDLTNVPCRIFS